MNKCMIMIVQKKKLYNVNDLPEGGVGGNIEKGKRKIITVALRVVLALRNNCSNNSSSLRTFISSSFICVFLRLFIF